MLTFQIAECDRQKAELEARLAEAEKERDSLETYMRERGIEIPEAPDAERPEENEKTK